MQMHWKANLTLPKKKIKRQRRTIILAISIDLSSPMICAKIRPKGLFSSEEEDF